ncbi:hypothetical protein LUZ60_016396 [Juncus effusus]|nr:hypothetical protein LUZ60_016396 [Juncus effusus]
MQETNYESNNFAKDNGIGAVGEELEISGGGATSNRWPREETLALLKIRSEMDAQFRDASPKGPLWEEVTRKLAELGYKRSAKKCREKFENVHKYYKRTKDCRSGQKDGKMYRFFEQLETLRSATSAPNPTVISATSAPNPTVTFPSVISATAPIPIGSGPPLGPIQPTPISFVAPARNAESGPLGFTTSSSGSEESDSEMTEAGMSHDKGGKKRKMMDLFEGLIKQVMERQEEMQRLFLETLEKRELERMAREDAWRRQETARLNREHEILTQERAIATSRDAALVSFIQRISMQSIQPSVMIPPLNVAVPHVPQKPDIQHKQQKQHVSRPPSNSIVQVHVPQEKEAEEKDQKGGNEIVLHEGYNDSAPSSSRWPKIEVHTLIKLRAEMETQYHESGPRGPMWEEISARMKRLGYNRNAKRCKEKWENINKYFKRVKESSKKRPEDSKTCPYFHDLDELYRKRLLMNGSGGGGSVVNTQIPSTAPSESESESRNGDESVANKVNGG